MDYVRRQTRAGYPLLVEALRQMANVLLECHLRPGPTFAILETVGLNWVQKFYQRHPEVKAVKIRAMDALHVHGANIGRLTEWFEISKENLPGVLLYNIYNMDDTGILLGHLRTAKQVIVPGEPTPHHKAPSTRESATILECVSTSGRVLKPTIILKAKTHQNNWYP